LDIDSIKHSQAIQALMKKEAVKNYPPPVITSAIKEYVTTELGLSASISELKWKEVINIKYKFMDLWNYTLLVILI